MLKNVLTGIGILLSISILTIGVIGYYFSADEKPILNFIKENPERGAISLVRNDTTVARQNPDQMMPLASTMKIIIAIEYAKQSARGQLNPDHQVPLDTLEKFYVPGTDGGAHEKWIEAVQDQINDDKISIREVAKGMIQFSSNANTEWLLNKLGMNRVNNRLDSLGLEKHSPVYYIVSSLFIGKERFPDLEGKELQQALRSLSQDAYITATQQIHQHLKTDTTYKQELGNFGKAIRKIWSDRLPASTADAYVSVMKKINSRTYFRKAVQNHLDEVFAGTLSLSDSRQKLKYAGSKGGSTEFLLTEALYATDQQGNKTQMAYFLTKLSYLEQMQLRLSMKAFDKAVLTSKAFRNTLKEALPDN